MALERYIVESGYILLLIYTDDRDRETSYKAVKFVHGRIK